MCHFNVKGVQISEFVRISELSDKIHYLASKLAIYNTVFKPGVRQPQAGGRLVS